MNVPEPVLLVDLKVGKLYFEEDKHENGLRHYDINIIKIEKIRLEQLITFTYSSLKNYNIFSEITGFNTL